MIIIIIIFTVFPFVWNLIKFFFFWQIVTSFCACYHFPVEIGNKNNIYYIFLFFHKLFTVQTRNYFIGFIQHIGKRKRNGISCFFFCDYCYPFVLRSKIKIKNIRIQTKRTTMCSKWWCSQRKKIQKMFLLPKCRI